MIKSFKHKGLERFFEDNTSRYLPQNCIQRMTRMLDRLNSAEIIQDMNIPGWKLHPLQGNKQQLWSISVSGNWRMTFRFEKGNAYEVNLEDYH